MPIRRLSWGGVQLSIVISTYNNAKYVTKAIDSCLMQETKYSYEVVVVNDGSTDNTDEVLRKYEADSRVKIFNQENRGFSGARNSGIEHSSGKWIMFLDSDDTLTDNSVDTMLGIAVEKDADIVEGNFEEVYSDGLKRRGAKSHPDGIHEISKDRILSTLRGYPWGKLIKSSLFRDTHFPERYWFEDTVMHMVVYPMAEKCLTTGAVVYNYFINPNGITSRSHGQKKCIDSFYVTRRLLADRKKLGIKFTVVDYIFFLGQVKMNWNRTRLLPEQVRRAVFAESCDLNRKYFGAVDDKNLISENLDGIYCEIKKSLDNRNYKDYVKAMTGK